MNCKAIKKCNEIILMPEKTGDFSDISEKLGVDVLTPERVYSPKTGILSFQNDKRYDKELVKNFINYYAAKLNNELILIIKQLLTNTLIFLLTMGSLMRIKN